MADIVLSGLTELDVTRILRNTRDASSLGDVIDITGFVLKLTVKRTLEDLDADAVFTLAAAIVDGEAGSYKFAFTLAHTSIPPRSYPAEIRYWESAVITGPPADKLPLTFTVLKSVKSKLGD